MDLPIMGNRYEHGGCLYIHSNISDRARVNRNTPAHTENYKERERERERDGGNVDGDGGTDVRCGMRGW